MSPRPHNRRRVNDYLRESLCIDKSVKALALCCSVTWDGVVKFRNRVRDESSLWSWYTYLEARKDEILKATAVELSATVVVHTGPAQITKRQPPRRGKHAEDDKNFKDLKTAVLGDKPGHNAEGSWCADASDVMRRRRDYLPQFDVARKIVGKVLGDERFLVTPCTMLCPFKSDTCCVRRLNRFGGISQLYEHWEKQHASNPASAQLIKRFKLALKDRKIAAAKLDVEAPLLRLEDEGHEEAREQEGYEPLRKPGEVLPAEAFFDYDFEIFSDEHSNWLNNTGTI